jgi:hypothetical protein
MIWNVLRSLKSQTPYKASCRGDDNQASAGYLDEKESKKFGNLWEGTMTAEAQATTQVKTKDTIPLWLAVGITVVVSLPFGLLLGKYSLPLFVSFIVWAEYFVLGAKPAALRIIFPAFIAGTFITAFSMFLTVVLTKWLSLNISLAISLFVVVSAMVYIMRYFKVLGEGSLPYFNGISMLLAVYFTGQYPDAATTNPYLQPWVAALWASLAGILGGLLGVFNIWIMFTHKAE